LTDKDEESTHLTYTVFILKMQRCFETVKFIYIRIETVVVYLFIVVYLQQNKKDEIRGGEMKNKNYDE
jgi:hypothetical protein